MAIFSKFTNSKGELAIVDEGITNPRKIKNAIELCKKRKNLFLSSENIFQIFLNKNLEIKHHIIGKNITIEVRL
nr:hypothetical protein [Treponema denticola]